MRREFSLILNISCDCVLNRQFFLNSTTLWLGKSGNGINIYPTLACGANKIDSPWESSIDRLKWLKQILKFPLLSINHKVIESD
ncbi:hypothetical protein EF405_08165 [Cyclobacteriaceae bacterium YHN15]|nr:hypothetical protein EF405_08165 [Cyclobacteriaceae bacterium YHN15]